MAETLTALFIARSQCGNKAYEGTFILPYCNCLQLAQGLRVRTYPYIGLLAFSGSRTRLIAAAEGHFTAEALLPILQEAQEQQAVHLVAEQAEQNERVSLLILKP